MTLPVRYNQAAEADLLRIQNYLERKASQQTVDQYLLRLTDYIATLSYSPDRGTIHARGVRVIGFERRVSIAFRRKAAEITILRIRYAGYTR